MSRIACPGREEPTAEVCGRAHDGRRLGEQFGWAVPSASVPKVEHMTWTAARIATTTLLGAASLMASAVLLAAPASAAPAGVDDAESCEGGVLVVVDFTDLGGEVETGCAEGDPESGRAALESAGFAPVDSDPGLICTIDAQPDPCPTEFDGSYWAYWQVQDGEWVASQVGLDEADPTPGGIEGWRYNDGSVPPPAVALEPSAAPTSESAADTTSEEASEDASGGVSPAIWAVIAVVVLGVVVGLVIRRSRAGDAGT